MSLSEQIQSLNEIDLSDVDFTRAGLWPTPAKLAILVVVMIAVLAGGYFLIVSPELEALKQSEEREATLKKTFEKRAHQASNIEDYRAQNVELVKRFDSLLNQLPSDTEVPGLLEDITDVGVNGGLKINKIDLQKEATKEFFIELPMSIQLTGSYHNFGSFVSGVAALPRIVTLHDFKISISTGKEKSLSMIIGAKTYRYRD